MTALRRSPSFPSLDEFDRLKLMLALSLALHLVLLIGVHFKAPEWNKNKDSANLEVVLVNSKSAHSPTHADALAQANLDGGGNTDAKRRAKSPLPALKQDQVLREISEKASLLAQKEREARALLTQIKSKASIEQPTDKSVSSNVKPDENLSAADSASISLRRSNSSREGKEGKRRRTVITLCILTETKMVLG